MKTYNGPQYDGVDTINENSFENVPEKGKKKTPIIILIVLGVIIGLLIIYGILSSMLTKILEHNSSTNEVLLEDDINETQTYDAYNNEEQENVNEFTGMIADTWENQGKNLSGRTLNYTYDGETAEESYWEFSDSKNAKLIMGDGSYYAAEYLVLEGNLGMLYTEYKFPEYGLTYDELSRVTSARKENDDTCNDYVVISFSNMVYYDSEGNTQEGKRDGMFFYGVNYNTDNGMLYDIVGANSADEYFFIDFDEK